MKKTHADLAKVTKGMTTSRWIKEIPAVRVPIDTLIPIQEAPVGDSIPHAVLIDGFLYLEDGHHRYYAALAAGEKTLLVRVLTA